MQFSNPAKALGDKTAVFGGFVGLQADERRAPGKSAAHGFHKNQLAGLDAAIGHAGLKSQRNRSCGGIRVLINRDNHLGGIETQF